MNINENWKSVIWSIVKYAIAAVCGGLGVSTVSGCCMIPQFCF